MGANKKNHHLTSRYFDQRADEFAAPFHKTTFQECNCEGAVSYPGILLHET